MTQLTGTSPSLEMPPEIVVPAFSDKDREALVGWAKDEYTKAKNARIQIQMQWYMNMAFLRGKQYAEYIPKLRKLGTPSAAPYRVRHTSNRIRPMVRTEIARLTSQKPSASVIPASSEDEDLFAAQAGEQVWESMYSRKKIHDVFRQSIFWTAVCGTSFIKTYWDQSAWDAHTKIAGDIVYGAVTPFHLFVPDLREPDIEAEPYIIHAYTRSVAWIRQFWKDRLQNDLNPNVVSANEILEDVWLGLPGGSSSNGPDSCLVLEIWVKPGAHKLFPQGGMMTLVDNQIVSFFSEGNPYQHSEYPYAKVDHIPTGNFYAESSITDLIPLQREYNRTRSQIIEAQNRTSKPQLLAPMGSINPAKITTEPGQVILYRPGFAPPQPLPIQSLPAYIFSNVQQILMDMEDISGQHQVSKGSAPAGVTAATAISFLQEKDDAYLTHTYQSVESAWEKIARHTLSHAVQYWDVPRLIRTVGSDGAFDSMMLRSSDIATGTDIRMEGGSSLPQSKAGRQAFLMDLMKMQFIAPEKGLELMEIGGVQKLYDQLKVDERQAQRENIRFKRMKAEEVMMHQQEAMMQMPDPDVETGMPMQPPSIIPVNTWDNHTVHIEVHNRFRKSQIFELLEEPVKIILEQHVQEHKMAQMQDMQEMAMQQMMAQGGGMMPPGEEEPPVEEPPLDQGAI